MTRHRRVWTVAEVLALGVRTDVPTAGEILAGLNRAESYKAVERGAFPVPVLRVGRRLVVPTAPIVRLLGLETEAAGPAPPGPADHSATAPPQPNEDTSVNEPTARYRRSA